MIPPLFFGQPFWNPAPDVHGWLYRALALLVVACPCALVISTPVTLVSAISNGARNGVVFKGGAYLEALSRVRAMALDKTGTITRGEPVVVSVHAAGCESNHTQVCPPCDDLRRWPQPWSAAANTRWRGRSPRSGRTRTGRPVPGWRRSPGLIRVGCDRAGGRADRNHRQPRLLRRPVRPCRRLYRHRFGQTRGGIQRC
ncbi:MAG: hypothetical protein R3C44_02525 [Chloroflexota bacterium]